MVERGPRDEADGRYELLVDEGARAPASIKMLPI